MKKKKGKENISTMYDWKQEGKGKGKEKYHSFPLQKEGKWEKKKCISTKS